MVNFDQTASGIQKVHAVIGDFHIVPTDEYIEQVIARLQGDQSRLSDSGARAGERLYDLVRVEMPDKMIHAAVGARFVFGA